MCDTDSVKYFDTCDDKEYRIKGGDCLGELEDEGQLDEFVSNGPKSYATRSGKEVKFVIKGCRIKRAHQSIITFDVLRDVVLKASIVKVPQLSFDYRLGQGIVSREFLKTLSFNPKRLKGIYDPVSTKLYPFGYRL